jgi:hypothetical protein
MTPPSPDKGLREAVITILEDHMSASFDGLGRGVVTLSGFEEAADAILALPALSVPEGWVAVPREPTEEMIAKAREEDGVAEDAPASFGGFYRNIYRAMLSAIPSRPWPIDGAGNTAPCAYCGAVRAKPCNDMLCPWAPPSPRASHTPPKATAEPPLSAPDAGAGDETNT